MLSTIRKMIIKIQEQPHESKYRSVRLGNPKFRQKVLAVPGGPELIIAAGFVLEDSSAQERLVRQLPENETSELDALSTCAQRLDQILGML